MEWPIKRLILAAGDFGVEVPAGLYSHLNARFKIEKMIDIMALLSLNTSVRWEPFV